MTKHTPNPNCDRDHCFVDDLNAVLRRFVEQREADQHNATILQTTRAKDEWRDTVGEGGR